MPRCGTLWKTEGITVCRAALSFDRMTRHLRQFTRLTTDLDAWYCFRLWQPQPITVPAAEIRRRVPFGPDVKAWLAASFSVPASRPALRIERWAGDDTRVPGLGHDGIALINGRTGGGAYWEYGRYDVADFGLVREVENVAAVTIDFEPDTGNPTAASRNALARQLVRIMCAGGTMHQIEQWLVRSHEQLCPWPAITVSPLPWVSRQARASAPGRCAMPTR